jgi:hypothetical protein
MAARHGRRESTKESLMRWIARAAILAAAMSLQACVADTPPPQGVAIASEPARAETRAPVTILVSIDGFRPT